MSKCGYYNWKYKANFPSRISFQVVSKYDSRTVLGEIGGTIAWKWRYAYVKKWWKYN